MTTKEESLKNLLKKLLEERLSHLEKRNINQMKDLKLEKESYQKQELLVKKLCSIKIEPKKSQASKNIKNNKIAINKTRDKTPNNLRIIRKNSIKKEVKRSKTPDIQKRNIKTQKKEKELKKTKSNLNIIKKEPKLTNISKIKQFSIKDNNKENNIKKNNNVKSIVQKAHTPDLKKINKKNVNKNNKVGKNNLNIKKINKEEIKTTKNEKKIENQIQEEKKLINLELVLGEQKIINTISLFLDTETQLNFFSCNKKLIKYIQEKLSNSLSTLEINNGVSAYSTVQDQINSLKLRYTEEQFNAKPQKFAIPKITLKFLDMLNNEHYEKIFLNKELSSPLNEIIFIYKIFFQFLKDNNLKKIKDDKLFWQKASDYILTHNNGKTGDFLKESCENLDFDVKNIYEAKKLKIANEERIKPAYFTSICGTTGLVTYLIKDILEYCGVIISTKKNVPIICLKYLEYIEETQNKLKNYIDKINEWTNKQQE